MHPEEDDLYSMGTVAHVLQIIKTSDSTVRVVVRGMEKACIKRLWQTKPFLQANVILIEDEFPGNDQPGGGRYAADLRPFRRV